MRVNSSRYPLVHQVPRDEDQSVACFRYNGARAASTDDSEEIASGGEPRGEHARHGGHDLPGDRPRE